MSFSVEVIAIAKLKPKSAFYELYDMYRKRLQEKFVMHELEGRTTEDEHKKIIEKINPAAAVIVLDETGDTISSPKFARKLEKLQIDKSGAPVQFIVGGADGLNDTILQRADYILSFGKQTWPHMMVRVMLIEQIYRAQQILSGHPYHRE